MSDKYHISVTSVSDLRLGVHRYSKKFHMFTLPQSLKSTKQYVAVVDLLSYIGWTHCSKNTFGNELITKYVVNYHFIVSINVFRC